MGVLTSELKVIPISKIDPSPFEPASRITPIDSEEIISPPVVRPNGARFELVTGHRRLERLKADGKTEAECKVVGMGDQEAALALFADNEDRKGWEDTEKGFYFRSLKDRFGLTEGQIAKLCRTSETTVSRCLGLVILGGMVAEATRKAPSKLEGSKQSIPGSTMDLFKHAMTTTKFKEINKLPADRQVAAARAVIEHKLSGDETREAVERAQKAGAVEDGVTAIVNARPAKKKEAHLLKKAKVTVVRCRECKETLYVTHQAGGKHVLENENPAFDSQMRGGKSGDKSRIL